MDVFPFKISSKDTGHCIAHPPFTKSFHASRPSGMSWYAFDVEVLSWGKAKFIVRDMADSFHGGIGGVKDEFCGPLHKEEVGRAVERRIVKIAKDIEQEEFDMRRAERVAELVSEISAATPSPA